MHFLPAITTTPGSDWQQKIRDCKLEEVCVFLTLLDREKRSFFYNLIERSTIKIIPFAHIRGDMSKEEIAYLRGRYRTSVFNLHSGNEYPIIFDYEEYQRDVYIENVYVKTDTEELARFGGLCLDFAHLENDRLTNKERYDYFIDIINSFKIGCNHISAVNPNKEREDERRGVRFDHHCLEDLSDLDYLDNYPQSYFSNFCALELENSLEEQASIISYLNKKYEL